MSYSLFSYLKENPRLNGPKVNYNWANILTDPDVPESVKSELNELISYKFMTLTDAVLFWSDHVQILRMTDTGEHRLDRRTGKQIWCTHKYDMYAEFSSQFALTAYSLIQLDADNAARYARAIYDEIFNDEAKRQLYCRLTNWTIDKVKTIFRFSRTGSSCAHAYYNNNSLNDNDCFDLYDWLDESFLTNITESQVREARQLIKDCDQPTTKFKSMNDIERAHDARTEREAAKLAAEDKTYLTYHTELEQLTKQYGFTLPNDNVSFIKRGRQHNNCVATYYHKHTANVFTYLEAGETHECSRLFFTELATLELSIEYCNEGIISTRVIQYKGRFNRDATRDKRLIAFRIALVGMPTEILVVRSNVK